MEVGDVCVDAKLPQVWQYLYNNKHLSVPDSWVQALDFDEEIKRIETWTNIMGSI